MLNLVVGLAFHVIEGWGGSLKPKQVLQGNLREKSIQKSSQIYVRSLLSLVAKKNLVWMHKALVNGHNDMKSGVAATPLPIP